MKKLRIEDDLLLVFALEIGAMNYGFHLDGIIGLDLLSKLKAVINIADLSLYSNR